VLVKGRCLDWREEHIKSSSIVLRVLGSLVGGSFVFSGETIESEKLRRDRIPMTCSKGFLLDFYDYINKSLSVVTDDEVEKLLLVPSSEKARWSTLKDKLDTLERSSRF
jgi:hypothetical protein